MNQDEENSRESKLEQHWRNLDSDLSANREVAAEAIYQELERIASRVVPGFRKLVEMKADIVQDCATRVLVNGAVGRDHDSVEAYLQACVKNQCKDYLRKLKRRREQSFDSLNGMSEDDDYEIQFSDTREDRPEDSLETADEERGSSRQIEELEAHLVAELDLLTTTMRRDAARSTELGIREILDIKLERSSAADLLEAEKNSGDGDEGKARARIHTRHSRARRKMIEHLEDRAKLAPSERPWSLLLDLIQRGLTENSA